MFDFKQRLKFYGGIYIFAGASVAPGDSGGGLAFEHNGLWYSQGIVSVGITQKLSYSAFTRIDAYTEWINQIVEAISSAGRWHMHEKTSIYVLMC